MEDYMKKTMYRFMLAALVLALGVAARGTESADDGNLPPTTYRVEQNMIGDGTIMPTPDKAEAGPLRLSR
jgi:hypothetical protein